jgi:hypothetical protein
MGTCTHPSTHPPTHSYTCEHTYAHMRTHAHICAHMRAHAHKVRWPGVVSAGGVTTQQWCFYDFLQTAAGIAGVQPDALPADLDGYSLLPTLMHGDGENACGRVHETYRRHHHPHRYLRHAPFAYLQVPSASLRSFTTNSVAALIQCSMIRTSVTIVGRILGA